MPFGAAVAAVAVAGGLIMPSFTSRSSNGLTLKVAGATLGQDSTTAFWDAIDLSHTKQGWESVKLAAAANTLEQTILDITDKGVLTQVVAPRLSTNGTMTIRVTADGTVTTFISETIDSNTRFCIGYILGYSAEISAANGQGIGSANDAGFSLSPLALLPTPLQTLAEGIIGIPYSTSLKVTVQGSVNIKGTALHLNCCANHTLFVPEGLS